MIRKNWLLIFGILTTIIIRAYFIFNGSEVGDIHTLFEMGDVTLKGNNPYLILSYNSYPPLALYLEIITIKLANLLHMPFFILIKFWPNIADLVTGLVIFWFLCAKGAKQFTATVWSLIFLLNPISILISSAHGQLDSLPNLLVILAIVMLQKQISRKRLFLAAITLGLAIAIKPNPLLLVPIFLLYLNPKTNLFEKISFLLLVLAPVSLLLLPFLQDNYQYLLTKLFSYSGASDFGLSAPLKTLYFYHNATYQLPNIDDLVWLSKWIFFTAAVLILVLLRKSQLSLLALLIYLLFLTSYFGISAQYLSWILALAVLRRDKMIVPYTIFGLIALLGFYLYFNPIIILSQFVNIPPFNFQFMLVYAFGNLCLWLTMLLWILKSIKSAKLTLDKN